MSKPPDLAEIEAEIERLSIEKDEAVKAADYERPPSCATRPSSSQEEGRDAARMAREVQGDRRRRR
jgi:ATP-dependent Clp protease ATP-binding subunit ClpC